MATLTSLSDELLIPIVEYVGAYTHEPGKAREKYLGPGYILNLALCSRRLHGICENILYSHVYQQGRGHNRSLDLFLETILARPDLAAKVKTFYAALFGTREDVLGYHITPHMLMDMVVNANGGYSKDRLAQICLAAENVYNSRNRFGSPRAMSNWELTVAYILIFLPNLEVVHCRGWVNLWPYILCPQNSASQNSMEEARVFGTFVKLKQVILEWHTDERISSERFDYLPWLLDRGKIPPVKSYSCVSSREIDHNFVVLSNDKSTPESQSLAKAGPTHITYYAPFDNDPLDFEFPASLLPLNRIVNFTETRHYRRWNYNPRGNWRLPKGDNVDRIGEDTVVKRKLVDQLVPTLEALALRRCVSGKEFDLVSNLYEMLEKKQQVIPNLRSLNLEWMQRADGSLASHLGFTSEEAGELLLMCREVGIQMVMGVDNA